MSGSIRSAAANALVTCAVTAALAGIGWTVRQARIISANVDALLARSDAQQKADHDDPPLRKSWGDRTQADLRTLGRRVEGIDVRVRRLETTQ